MVRRIQPALTLLILLVLFGFPTGTIAQTSPTLGSMEVDLWPEYDRADILVIYRAELEPTVSLPADLTFKIPARAGMPHAVATGQSDGNLFNVTAERVVNGDWALISFTTTMPIVRLEFYDPGIERENSVRRYTYSWNGDYAVDSLLIQVQQPLGAIDMKITPQLGNGVVGSDGLVYYNSEIGSLAAGQTFSLDFSYQKENDSLSISSLNVEPSEPLIQQPAETGSMVAWLPYLLGVAGAALILGAIYWYWRSSRPLTPAAASRGRRVSNQKKTASPIPSETGKSVYCHQCGRRAAPGDQFCRSCGVRLRVG